MALLRARNRPARGFFHDRKLAGSGKQARSPLRQRRPHAARLHRGTARSALAATRRQTATRAPAAEALAQARAADLARCGNADAITARKAVRERTTVRQARAEPNAREGINLRARLLPRILAACRAAPCPAPAVAAAGSADAPGFPFAAPRSPCRVADPCRPVAGTRP